MEVLQQVQSFMNLKSHCDTEPQKNIKFAYGIVDCIPLISSKLKSHFCLHIQNMLVVIGINVIDQKNESHTSHQK